MSCCEPSAPEGATSAVIGRMQFAGDGMCYDQRPLTFKAGECCLPSGPSDPKWAAAYPGLRDLLLEVDALSTIDTDCCALPNPFKSKADLDEKWMPKVNAHLATHGLVAQLHAFWSYNGQSSQPMMHMLVYKLGPEAEAERARLAKISQENVSKGTKGAPQQVAMARHG